MLTYQIKSTLAQHRRVIGKKCEEFLSKEAILKRNLEKTWLAVGDIVRFKKPRRNPVMGVIVHIEDDHDRVTFSNGGTQAMNISVKVDKFQAVDGGLVKYGEQIVKTNVKKLVFVSRGKDV